jgi:hypothetical protein
MYFWPATGTTTRSLHPTMEVRILSFHLTRSLSKLHTMHSPHCQTQPIKSEHSLSPLKLETQHSKSVTAPKLSCADTTCLIHPCRPTTLHTRTKTWPRNWDHARATCCRAASRDARHQHRSPGAWLVHLLTYIESIGQSCVAHYTRSKPRHHPSRFGALRPFYYY